MSNVISLFQRREQKKVREKMRHIALRLKDLEYFSEAVRMECVSLFNSYIFGMQILEEEMSDEELEEFLYPPNKQLEFDFVYEGRDRETN